MTTMVNPPASKSKSNPLVYTPFLQPLRAPSCHYTHTLVLFWGRDQDDVRVVLDLGHSLVLVYNFPTYIPHITANQNDFANIY